MNKCTTYYCENEATQTGTFVGDDEVYEDITYCDDCAEMLGESFAPYEKKEEDFTDLVTNIQLGRIYDVLLVLLSQFDKDLAAQVAEVHKAGQFVGPLPAYDPNPEEDDVAG